MKSQKNKKTERWDKRRDRTTRQKLVKYNEKHTPKNNIS